jgi:hypothetical protein
MNRFHGKLDEFYIMYDNIPITGVNIYGDVNYGGYMSRVLLRIEYDTFTFATNQMLKKDTLNASNWRVRTNLLNSIYYGKIIQYNYIVDQGIFEYGMSIHHIDHKPKYKYILTDFLNA